MISFRVEGEELARATYNALAFTPARSPIPVAKMYIDPKETFLLATDTYAIGRPSLGPTQGIGRPVSLELTRDDLARLDKIGRACKGELSIKIPDDNGLIATGLQVDVEEVIPSRAVSLNYDRGVWQLCEELLECLENRPQDIPTFLAVDPSLLARFGKIKTPKGTSALLDMKITSSEDPILIKCGPQFTGVLMPVNRSVARQAATRGGDFLW
ncbi:hypothetical protein ACFYZH_10095 [Streptomyces abikoensis]|uniref:hypothetical protein n=1 Tax=Streptomyces abikoensis TaxID=97398 RepID=UPI003689681F